LVAKSSGKKQFDKRRQRAHNDGAAGVGRFRPTLGLSPGRFFVARFLLLGKPGDHVGKNLVPAMHQRRSPLDARFID
jgi:hypothetical protein